MSALSPAPSGAVSHCLVVEAEPQTNALLRVLEPFVIHDVVPSRVETAHLGDGEDAILRLEIRFATGDALAERLKARLDTMVTVRTCHLVRALDVLDQAA